MEVPGPSIYRAHVAAGKCFGKGHDRRSWWRVVAVQRRDTWLSVDVSAFRHPGIQKGKKPCLRESRNPDTRNPVDRWIHAPKSRRSLTRLSISEFGDLNDEESWSRCISNSRVPKPRKDPYRWIRGGLRPSIFPLEGNFGDLGSFGDLNGEM
jgi:hypothetical protein